MGRPNRRALHLQATTCIVALLLLFSRSAVAAARSASTISPFPKDRCRTTDNGAQPSPRTHSHTRTHAHRPRSALHVCERERQRVCVCECVSESQSTHMPLSACAVCCLDDYACGRAYDRCTDDAVCKAALTDPTRVPTHESRTLYATFMRNCCNDPDAQPEDLLLTMQGVAVLPHFCIALLLLKHSHTRAVVLTHSHTLLHSFTYACHPLLSTEDGHALCDQRCEDAGWRCADDPVCFVTVKYLQSRTASLEDLLATEEEEEAGLGSSAQEHCLNQCTASI